MKSFTQYLETIIHEKDPNSFYHCIDRIQDKKTIVKIALLCAEEVSDLNPHSRVYIDLAKKWLNNEDSVSTEEIQQTIRDNVPLDHSSLSAVSVLYCILHTNRYQILNSARDAASYASWGISHQGKPEDRVARHKKAFDKFKTIAQTYSSRSDVKPNLQTIHTDDYDTSTLMAIVDELTDHKEDFIKELNGEFSVNLPGKYKITGNSYNDVIDKIVKNNDLKWILDYVRRIYK